MLRTHCGVFRGLPTCSLRFHEVDPFLPSFLSPKKGVVWTNIDFSGFAVLLQFATTHRSGIFARTLSRFTSFLRNGFPGRRHRSNSNPFSLNSVVNQNGANFSNFDNSQKIEQKAMTIIFSLKLSETKVHF